MAKQIFRKGIGKHNKTVEVIGSKVRVFLGRKGRNGYWATMSVHDIDILKSHGFYLHKRNDGLYVARSCQTGALMHRLILSDEIEECLEELEVDHIDADPLNNCRGNLRLSSASQNKLARQQRNLATGFYGVREKGDLYQIWDGVNWVGTYECPHEAAEARDDAMFFRYKNDFEYVQWSTLSFIRWNYPGVYEEGDSYEEWLDGQLELAEVTL
ncbi:HNH endonuclease [Endozoicomonas sp. 4G]|uniref:HNH endonuclease n=1 Tax=Endozoicomonas sp. 4G TaxID=2872754 RepID=UPI002078B20D|nr:HNH endonuclease [Endozoicomonas sp. 4G]